MNCTKKNIELLDILHYICIGLSFCFLCAISYWCFFESVWCDEVFSLTIVQGSYIDILFNTAMDVHPPLYYFILKFFTDIFCFAIPSINVVILSKIVSMASLFILFYFCVFKLSKLVSKHIVSLFLVVLCGVFFISDFSITIRMYGYALLFVFVALYYVIRIIKFNTNKDWRGFVLFFELSALTHYFALIAVAGMFVYLLTFILINRKQDFWKWYKYLFCAILIYLPWLVVFVCQFAYILSFGYWITSPDSSGVFSLFNYAFNPSVLGASGVLNVVLTIAVILIYFILFGLVIKNKKIEKNEKWIAFLGMFSTIFIYFVGLLVSFLFTPIFVERYTNSVLGIMCFSYAYVIWLFVNSLDGYWFEIRNKTKNNLIKVLSVVVILIVSIYSLFNIVNVFKQEKINNNYYLQNQQFFDSKKDYLFVSDYGRVQSVLEYSHNVKIEGLEGEDVSWWENVTGIKHNNLTVDQIKENLSAGKKIIFLNSNFDLIEFDKNDIEYQKLTILNTESNDVIEVYELKMEA